MSELEPKIEILESETVKTDNGQTVSFNIESPTDWRMSCEGLMMQVHTLPRPINFQTDEDLVTIKAD